MAAAVNSMFSHPGEEGVAIKGACSLWPVHAAVPQSPVERPLEPVLGPAAGMQLCVSRQKKCVQVLKGARGVTGDGNDNVLLSLHCFLCTLVKTWSHSV